MQNSWIRKINGSEKKGNFKYREPSFNLAVIFAEGHLI